MRQWASGPSTGTWGRRGSSALPRGLTSATATRRRGGPPPAEAGTPIAGEAIAAAPAAAQNAQRAFERTGGLHATGLFEPGGELLVLFEDVGRHNAMDKAIGSMLLAGRF